MTKNYSFSKFEGPITEKLYDMSLEGMCDEEIGTIADIGWHGIFIFVDGAGVDIHKDLKGAIGAILREDSQGFVTSDIYTNQEELDSAISDLEDESDII